jgi:phosphate transport system substrate-binding protein
VKTSNRNVKRAVNLIAAIVSTGMLVAGPLGAPDAQAASYVPISGTGSTWSQNALEQWRKNVAANYGITINYSGTGSSAGRRDFIQETVDFAVSEIPFQSAPEDGSPPEVSPVGYAYMPIVAGGTSLMYNLKIAGQRVTNLRLSGEVVTKIFSGQITNWNDASIQADNPALAMPDKPIVPVVRSDGSGTSAQFTMWMSSQFSSIWSFGMRSQFPTIDGFKYQSGSNGVAGYVSQDYGEGAITYVEYSYALNAGFPVVKLLNNSGYYIEPTYQSVAVALLSVRVNSDLTQDLTGVFNSSDPRSYPMSSYSYMIVPTQTTKVFTAQKGATLGAFTQYMLCEGQNQAADLGYSPLTINLVKAGFDVIKRIPGAESISTDINSCNNPTFNPGDSDSSNKIALTAPQPADCDKQGDVQCTTGTGGAQAETPVSGPGTGGAAAGKAGTSGVNGSRSAGSAGMAGTTAGASPFSLPDDPWGGRQLLMLFAGLFLIAAVAVPPLMWDRVKRLRSPRSTES